MFAPRLILDGAPLIAVHKGRYYRRQDGLALGPGPFVTGLEYAADCRATVVGKPDKTFFTQVRPSFHPSRSKVRPVTELLASSSGSV